MAPDTTTNRSGPAAGFSPGLILAFVCMGQFMVFTDVSIVNLALPSIQDSLGMTDVSLGYIVTAYGTVLGGFLLLGGRLADTFGRRRMLQIGFTVFALASLTSGLADSSTVLIVSRAVQGFGASLITPAALSILTNTFPEGVERNKALGIWGSLAGIASIVGVILGGVLSDGPGWEWIFWINVPIGAAAVLLAPRLVPESRAEGTKGRFDTPGAVTLTAALLLLIFTLGEATHQGWGSARTVGGLIGAAVLLAAFITIELKVKSPMMPPSIFRLRTMRVANISAVMVFGTFGALFFFASLFMQQVYGYSPLKAGFAYVPLAFCVAAGAGVASGLTAKFSARVLVMAGLVLTITGLLLLWQASVDGSYAMNLLPPFILLGLGCGMVFVTLQIAAFVGVSDEHAGVGAGLINTSQEAGGALGLAVIATIAYNGMTSEMAATNGKPELITEVQAAANQDAFLSAAVAGLIALLVVAFLMPRGKHQEPGTPAAAPAQDNLDPAPAEK